MTSTEKIKSLTGQLVTQKTLANNQFLHWKHLEMRMFSKCVFTSSSITSQASFSTQSKDLQKSRPAIISTSRSLINENSVSSTD